MATAFAAVPSPVNARRADHAEDLMSDVWRIGRAWTEFSGGYAELHVVRFPSGKFTARWGSRTTGIEADGDCFVDAVLALAKKLAENVREWSKDDSDLAPALAASLAMLETP